VCQLIGLFGRIPECCSTSSECAGRAPLQSPACWCGKERNFSGEHFWARGYAVSTVGFELEQVKTYIREQEAADEQADNSELSHEARIARRLDPRPNRL
jgi:hypothetical protein